VIANFSGYLNLLPCFSSDGRHLLAHLRAARMALAERAGGTAAGEERERASGVIPGGPLRRWGFPLRYLPLQ
jgi:hypothetical protein